MLRSARLWMALAFLLPGVLAVAFTWLPLDGTTSSEAGNRIGGPFELVNTDGETVTEKDFRGQYKLVTFGYTYCPDVCPLTLSHITRALRILENKAPDKVSKVTPIFITIDPARDTVTRLGAYIENFHPRIVALTGSDEQVAEAAKAYKVRYWRVEDSEGAGVGEYTMAHTGDTFVIAPEGTFIDSFDHTTKGATIAKALDTVVPAGQGES